MRAERRDPRWQRLGVLFRAHPWHGVPIGTDAPRIVTAYIEIVPTDTVKYEMEKGSGFVKTDRPQQFSNVCPTLYGFIPQTLCAARVGALCAERTGRANITGDGDPLDICVLTEKSIPRGDILVSAIPIGGLRTLDNNAADDKIIAAMQHDAVYGRWENITVCPSSVIERLKHYFLTYKDAPDTTTRTCEILQVYDCQEAYEVIRRSQEDYSNQFGHVRAD
jgi:inorganic pyrophosphatase